MSILGPPWFDGAKGPLATPGPLDATSLCPTNCHGALSGGALLTLLTSPSTLSLGLLGPIEPRVPWQHQALSMPLACVQQTVMGPSQHCQSHPTPPFFCPLSPIKPRVSLGLLSPIEPRVPWQNQALSMPLACVQQTIMGPSQHCQSHPTPPFFCPLSPIKPRVPW